MGAVKTSSARADRSYLERTRRPLNCLVFMLPLLAAYEIGGLFYRHELLAPRHLAALLGLFGATARFLPALLVVAVLLIWHALSRGRWHVDGDAVAGMAVESILGMIPLLALNKLMFRLFTGVNLAARAGSQMPLPARILSGVGAGIYEEFVFRLAAIGLILFVCVDVLRAPKRPMAALALCAASVIFSLYHFLGPDPFDWYHFVFRAIAGLYLALLYVGRGLGVAVGAHACYNVISELI